MNESKKLEKIIESTKINEDTNQDKHLLDSLKALEKSLRAVGDLQFELAKDLSSMTGYVENMLKANTPVDGRGILKRINPLTDKLDVKCVTMWKDWRNTLEKLMYYY